MQLSQPITKPSPLLWRGVRGEVVITFNPYRLFANENSRFTMHSFAFDSYSREISLPIYPELDPTKINYIVEAVASAYQALKLITGFS